MVRVTNIGTGLKISVIAYYYYYYCYFSIIRSTDITLRGKYVDDTHNLAFFQTEIGYLEHVGGSSWRSGGSLIEYM